MWLTIQAQVPTDSQQVWVRIQYFYGTPCLAVYSSSNQTFTTSTTGIIIPAYLIARWKPIT